MQWLNRAGRQGASLSGHRPCSKELQRAREELQLERVFARLDRYAVIILDDIGYVKRSDAETHVLFELIAHRYESRSMIITANHPFSDWDQIFTDSIMTVAAIDRLVHHAIIIEIEPEAESFRKKQAKNRNESLADSPVTPTTIKVINDGNGNMQPAERPI